MPTPPLLGTPTWLASSPRCRYTSFPDGIPAHRLCTALTALISLQMTGGHCAQLPPAISALSALRDLGFKSCTLPAVPDTISALTAVTNLFLDVRA